MKSGVVKKRNQIKELYYIRAIAAVGILIIHATGEFALHSEFGSRAMILGVFLNQFFRFGSPIFMTISGLVLFYNYRSIKEFNFKVFYKKKAQFILIPYTLWSFIYFCFKNRFESLAYRIEHLPIFFKGLFIGNNFNHLYFIVLIFQMYLILPLFIKYLIKPMKEKPIKMFVSLFLIQAIILVYGRYFRSSGATGLIRYFNIYYWQSLFGWFYYFLAGGILGIHYNKIVDFIDKNIRKLIPIYIIVMILYIGEVYLSIYTTGGRELYDNFGSIRPHTLIYATITMPILIWITRKMVGRYKLTKSFGTYSLGIYFAHPFVLQNIKINLFRFIPGHFGYSRISALILLVVLGISITFGLVLFIALFKKGWILLGRVPQFKFKKEKVKIQA